MVIEAITMEHYSFGDNNNSNNNNSVEYDLDDIDSDVLGE